MKTFSVNVLGAVKPFSQPEYRYCIVTASAGWPWLTVPCELFEVV